MPSTAAAPSTTNVTKPQMEQILRQMESLPTLPNIVYELSRIINDPTSSAVDVSKVMEKDQSLAAKVLKLVNSAYYGIPGGIANLHRAISYLGYDAINQLVLTASVFQNLNKPTKGAFNLGEFWKHAVAVAMTAETIAKWTKFHSPTDCFSSGLLHDIGKVALCQIAPEIFDSVVELAKKENISVLDAETKLGLTPHTHVGSMLAGMWKLPPVIDAVILYHHEHEVKKRVISKSDINFVVDIVYLSNSIVHQLQFGDSGHNKEIPVDTQLLKRLQVNSAQIPLILKDIARTISTADDFIRVIAG